MTRSPRQSVSSAFVAELMNAGWKRRDAEDLEVVQDALEHARTGRPLHSWADRAARALRREPVLAGAVQRFASDPRTERAVLDLYLVASEEHRFGLFKLLIASQRPEPAFELGYDEGPAWGLD